MAHVLLTCEGSTDSSEGGLYLFAADSFGKNQKAKADLPLGYVRDVVAHGQEWYALTNEDICQGSLKKGQNGYSLTEPAKKFSLIGLYNQGHEFIDEIFKEDQSKIFGHLLVDEQQGSIDLLANFYYEKNLKDKVLGGPLLRFQRGNLESSPVLTTTPRQTGIIQKHQGKLFTVSYDTVYSPGMSYTLKGGNVLAALLSGDLLVIINNNSQYLVASLRNSGLKIETPAEPNPKELFDNPLLLPSEATSALLMDGQNEREKYLAFGLDDGKVKVFRLDQQKMSLQPVGTLNFLSLEERIHKGVRRDAKGNIIQPGGKDDHVRYLKGRGFRWYFAHRNCVYGYPAQMLLELLQQNKGKLEKKVEDYGIKPEVTFQVPHRLTKMEFIP